MELHQTIRDLVSAHGPGILGDATGFRGVLDDVLDEGAASTGDINLLVDAVRFDVLTPLTQMIDGGADPGRAVEEAGARLARERGGDDHTSGAWAAAVLGYAVGRVPEAIVARYRSHRPPSSFAPPAAGQQPLQSPVQRPLQSPIAPPVPPAPPAGWPGMAPPPPPAPASSNPSPYAAPAGPPAYASPTGGTRRRSHKGIWIGAAVALVLVVGGGIGAAVALSGGSGPRHKDSGSDTSASALDSRYSGLGSSIAAGTSDCASGHRASGESEQVVCKVAGGRLTLTTYDSLSALKSARQARLDRRAGSITDNAGDSVYYSFDPHYGQHKSDPALIYWDAESGLQSATLQGAQGTPLTTVSSDFDKTGSTSSAPTGPMNATLQKFIGHFVNPSTCKPHALYDEGASEEVICSAKMADGTKVGVFFGRYPHHSGMFQQRAYYSKQYAAASKTGKGGHWKFGHQLDFYPGGAYYTYVSGGAAITYWDWNESSCNCWAFAVGPNSTSKMDAWWAKASKRQSY
ncbi:MAG: hypothetical protein FWE71_15955 [Nocardioidaceae bacterium]|nr:hypothetical protein [Nocardioidaceae bacterium]MCL2612692.1 hypothetical protein [Nocardioidaceae bacterium]